MGKVFDALKRAEEERKAAAGGRSGVSTVPSESEEAEATGESSPVSRQEPAPAPSPESGPQPRKATARPATAAPEPHAPPSPRPVPPRRRRSLARAGGGVTAAFRTMWEWVRTRGRMNGRDDFADVKRRIIQFDPYSPAAEQYRAIRTRIELLNEKGECRTIAVISALPDEGKTMTAINLALVMAMSVNRRVLLVDCDLRTPRVHSTLEIAADAGLSEVLRGEVPLEKALYEIPKERLTVLPAGTLPSNPAELLATQHMRDTMQQVRERFDHVIVDTPPALHVADAEIVGNLVDGIIFVVKAGATPREQVMRAMENFDRERLVGMVLNSAEDLEAGDYGSED